MQGTTGLQGCDELWVYKAAKIYRAQALKIFAVVEQHGRQPSCSSKVFLSFESQIVFAVLQQNSSLITILDVAAIWLIAILQSYDWSYACCLTRFASLLPQNYSPSRGILVAILQPYNDLHSSTLKIVSNLVASYMFAIVHPHGWLRFCTLIGDRNFAATKMFPIM